MIELAKDLVSRDDWLILDTETTGLDNQAQACQIGVLAPTGKVVLDTLVKPTISIPSDVTRIHGITNDDVKDAPFFLDIMGQLLVLIEGKTIVVYNAPYDQRILKQSLSACGIKMCPDPFPPKIFVDVMQPYAEYWGDWSEWHHSYKWQKLTNACRQQSIPINGAHSAIGDCQMTLALIKTIAAKED